LVPGDGGAAAEDLGGPLEEGAGAVGLAGRDVQEVRVVGPDVRRAGAVLFEDSLEELIGFLFGGGKDGLVRESV
jgi:hypothetical protein